MNKSRGLLSPPLLRVMVTVDMQGFAIASMLFQLLRQHGVPSDRTSQSRQKDQARLSKLPNTWEIIRSDSHQGLMSLKVSSPTQQNSVKLRTTPAWF